MLVVVLFAAAIAAQDQQPGEKAAAGTTRSKQLQELENQKREIKGRYNAAHKGVTAAKQQLADPDFNRTADERTRLQAELSKLQMQELELSAMLEATNRLIADVQKDQPPTESDQPPFTASLLLVKADWSKSPKASDVERELRAVLANEVVSAKLLENLPATGAEILFPPELLLHYSTEHYNELLAWLGANDLVRQITPFPIPGQIQIQPGQNETPDGFLIPRGQRRGPISYLVTSLVRPYSFLLLPPLDANEAAPPFVTRQTEFRWHISDRHIGVGASLRDVFYLEWQLAVSEHGRGQSPLDAPLRLDVLGRTAFSFVRPSQPGVSLVNAFAGHYGSVLREAARKQGFEAIIAIENHPGAAPRPPAPSRLHLPDHVEVMDVSTTQASGKDPLERLKSSQLLPPAEQHHTSTAPSNTTAAEGQPGELVLKVFTLRNIKARDAERIVQQLFARDIQSAAADERTNSLIVRGSEEQLQVIYQILTRLDEPEAKAGQKAVPPVDSSAAAGNSAATASVEDLQSRFEKKDRQAIWLAGQIRELQVTPKPNQATLDKLSADLRSVVGEAFALRQQLHQAELGELRERMQGLQQTLEARSRISDAIVQRRLEDLLNPNLQWDDGGATAVVSPPAATTTLPQLPRPTVQYGTYWSPDALQVLQALGLETQQLTREDASDSKLIGTLKIAAIAADSPASALRVGDIITMMQITGTVFGGTPRQAKLIVRRGAENMNVTVDFPAEGTSNSPRNSEQASPAPIIGAGGNSATVTLRTPDEFRQQLLSAENAVKGLQETYRNFPRDTTEERKKAREATIERAQQRVELLRAEYAAQIHLLELEANAATAELKNAEEGVQIADAGFKAAKKPRSAVIEARQQLVAAQLRLERATTLLDLYRKADPKTSTAGTPTSVTAEVPAEGSAAAPPQPAAPRPAGWVSGNRDFEFRKETEIKHGGEASALLRSLADSPKSSGAFLQMLRADKYRGKRLKLSGYVKAEDVAGWGGLWMRIDLADKAGVAYGNTRNQEAKGTTDWKEVEIVLDVPQDARTISFGGTLVGAGKLWVDDLSLTAVGNDVPATGLPVNGYESKQPPPENLPEAPRNLDFEK